MSTDTLDLMPPEVTQEAEAAQSEAQAIELQATGLVIATDEQYTDAAGIVKDLKARAKAIEAKRVELTQPLNESLKRINEMFKAPHARILAASDRIGRGMISYQDEQTRLRREAERKAEEVRRREQERLDKLAMERAARAEAKGDTERAAEILDTVPQAPPPAVYVPPPPVVKGLTTRSTWRAEVTDLAALVTACASGEVPLEAVQANMVMIGQTARALKDAMKWPGVRVVEDKSIAGTGR